MEVPPPWTKEEDFCLIQGHARFLDNFNAIHEAYPQLKKFRVEKLSERWDEMRGIDNEAQEAFEKFKKANHYGNVLYDYTKDVDFVIPKYDSYIDNFKDMPSLSQKAQSDDMQLPYNPSESNDILELSLNHYFDAKSVLDIISKSLANIVSDATLRETLLLDQKRALIIKGQKIMAADFSRRIGIIALDTKDNAQCEKECQILKLQYQNSLDYVKSKTLSGIGPYRRVPIAHVANDMKQYLRILYCLHDQINWSDSDKPCIVALRNDCRNSLLLVCSSIILHHVVDQDSLTFFQNFINWIIKIDVEEKVESQLAQRQDLVKIFQTRRLAIRQQQQQQAMQH